jgi:hypothetical protein
MSKWARALKWGVGLPAAAGAGYLGYQGLKTPYDRRETKEKYQKAKKTVTGIPGEIQRSIHYGVTQPVKGAVNTVTQPFEDAYDAYKDFTAPTQQLTPAQKAWIQQRYLQDLSNTYV